MDLSGTAVTAISGSLSSVTVMMLRIVAFRFLYGGVKETPPAVLQSRPSGCRLSAAISTLPSPLALASQSEQAIKSAERDIKF